MFFNDNSCYYSKHHETKWVFTGTFVALALPRMERLVPIVLLIVNKNRKRVTLSIVNEVTLLPGCARESVVRNVNKIFPSRYVYNTVTDVSYVQRAYKAPYSSWK